MSDDKEKHIKSLMTRQGLSPNLVDAVRDILAGKKVDATVDDEDAVELKKQAAEALDPVNPKELKGKHAQRKDKDIDNDGKVTDSDRYLHNRRKIVMKKLRSDKTMGNKTMDEALAKGYRPNSNYEGPPSIGDIMKSAKPGKVGRLKEVPLADRHKHNINHYAVVHNGERQSSHMFAGAHEKAQKAADDYRAKLAKQGKPTSGVTVHAYASEEVEETNEDYGATQNAMAHAKRDGANYNHQDVQHRYDAYHMKKKGYTHFEPQRMGGRKYNKIGVGTKIEPKHYSGVNEETVDEISTATLNRYYHKATVSKKDRTAGINRAREIQRKRLYKAKDEGKPYDTYKGEEVQAQEGAFSRMDVQKKETERLGAKKVKGDGMKTYKPASTLIANPKTQQVRRVTPSRAASAVKKGFVYAEDKQPVDEVSVNKLSQYMSKSAANVSGKDAKTQDKRIAGQSMADKKIRKAGGYSSTAKVAATNEETGYDQAKKKLQRMKKGSTVSFTHTQTGKKVSGQYHGLRNMGGRSYAHVETGKTGAFRVPVHHIHQVREELEEARRGRPPKSGVAKTDDTEARQHIVMQLRKSVSLRGQHPVEFKSGPTHKVTAQHAAQALNIHNNLRTPAEKSTFAAKLHKSHDSFKAALKDPHPGKEHAKKGITLPGSSRIGGSGR